jgi:hypothetical protein
MNVNDFHQTLVEHVLKTVNSDLWGLVDLDRTSFILELKELWLSKLCTSNTSLRQSSYIVDETQFQLLEPSNFMFQDEADVTLSPPSSPFDTLSVPVTTLKRPAGVSDSYGTPCYPPPLPTSDAATSSLSASTAASMQSSTKTPFRWNSIPETADIIDVDGMDDDNNDRTACGTVDITKTAKSSSPQKLHLRYPCRLPLPIAASTKKMRTSSPKNTSIATDKTQSNLQSSVCVTKTNNVLKSFTSESTPTSVMPTHSFGPPSSESLLPCSADFQSQQQLSFPLSHSHPCVFPLFATPSSSFTSIPHATIHTPDTISSFLFHDDDVRSLRQHQQTSCSLLENHTLMNHSTLHQQQQQQNEQLPPFPSRIVDESIGCAARSLMSIMSSVDNLMDTTHNDRENTHIPSTDSFEEQQHEENVCVQPSMLSHESDVESVDDDSPVGIIDFDLYGDDCLLCLYKQVKRKRGGNQFNLHLINGYLMLGDVDCVLRNCTANLWW